MSRHNDKRTPAQIAHAAKRLRYIGYRYPIFYDGIMNGLDRDTIARKLRVTPKRLKAIIKNIDYDTEEAVRRRWIA